jgi:hypothetical protein
LIHKSLVHHIKINDGLNRDHLIGTLGHLSPQVSQANTLLDPTEIQLHESLSSDPQRNQARLSVLTCGWINRANETVEGNDLDMLALVCFENLVNRAEGDSCDHVLV